MIVLNRKESIIKHFLFVAFLSLFSASCSKGRGQYRAPEINVDEELTRILPSKEFKEFVKNRCIQPNDVFQQGQDERLYGIDCIDGKQLLSETAQTGKEVSISHAVHGLRLEEELDFIGKVYELEYKTLRGEGDDKKIAFLRDFLPENKRFLAVPNKKYHIVFELHGDYLILFKASKNLNDLPHTERTSLTRSKDKQFYMVPFIGYPIQYCHAETIRNNQGEETYESRKVCHAQRQYEETQPDKSKITKNAPYIYVSTKSKDYNYKHSEKKDLLPSSYFDGQWFFSMGPIEVPPSLEGHLAPARSHLVKLRKKSDELEVVDDSGDVEEINKKPFLSIPVKWLEYEVARNGDVFESFGERFYNESSFIERPYLRVDFPKSGFEIEDVIVTNDYFSYVLTIPVEERYKRGFKQSSIRTKVSLLRKDSVDTQGFIPKRWFKNVHDHYFGTMITSPQDTLKEGEGTKEHALDQVRIIRFNTSLNTEKEKKTKTKVIKWYYSKNSTKDPEIRSIAEKAVNIWNRAFEIITEKSDTKIKVVLDKKEAKDLGDLRYNIINILKSQDIGESSLLGKAPAYVNPNTGQIIGTTANVFVHTVLRLYHSDLRKYIRYEIFQKDKKTDEENEAHVLSPYLRAKIQNHCPEAQAFIAQSKNRKVKPLEHLDDIAPVVSCGKKIMKEEVLSLTLHEMGHSFGLAHNFRASTDRDNYYQSLEELKSYFPKVDSFSSQLPKTSSVMDYLPSRSVSQPQSLGKYDLEALRFLYLNQVETKEGKIVTLNIPENPEEQREPIEAILSQKKPYLHCSDGIARYSTEDVLCMRYDHGANPLEIVSHKMENIKRQLNTIRYRYDSIKTRREEIYPFLTTPTRNIIKLYKRWIKSRDEYLAYRGKLDSTKYILGDTASIKAYQDIISEEGSQFSEEYKAFYPIREVVSQFLMDDFLFLKSMRCEVKDNTLSQSYFLNLESIKEKLANVHKQNLYVEDCYSEQILNFFAENNLTFLRQTGMEEFTKYYPRGKHSDEGPDVIPISNLFDWWSNVSITFENKREPVPLISPEIITKFTDEPDFFEIFRQKLESFILEGGTGNTQFDYDKMLRLFNSGIVFNFKRTLGNSPSSQRFYKKNLDHFSVVSFAVGTGDRSFYRRIVEPVKKGWDVTNSKIPFLTSAYEEYKSSVRESSIDDFQNYLTQMDATVNMENSRSRSFYIPYLEGGFASKILKKYNENQKAFKYLNRQERERELSVIEEMKRDSLELHSNYLRIVLDWLPRQN